VLIGAQIVAFVSRCDGRARAPSGLACLPLRLMRRPFGTVKGHMPRGEAGAGSH